MRFVPRSRRARVASALLALVALLCCVPLAFRAAAALRETNDARSIAPREGSFVDVAGLSMYFQELGPVSAETTVVFVPGTMAWSGTFRDLAIRLAARGHRVVAIDLPPFGFSERSPTHDYDRVAQAKRVVAFLDARGIERVVLVGHSFGGGATVETAMSLGPRVRALGLIDVALGLETPPAVAPGLFATPFVRDAVVACSFTNVLGTAAAVRALVEVDACVTERRVAIYQRPFPVAGTTSAVGSWLVSGFYADERRALSMDEASYRAFVAPTLVLWGRADTVTPLAHGEHLAALLPHAELVVLDGVGHIPHIENLEAVTSALLAFLGRLPAAPAE